MNNYNTHQNSKIIGHSPPLKEYPSLVAPIIITNSTKQKLVVYLESDNPEPDIVPIDNSMKFVAHDPEISKQLNHFSIYHHRLFALSENNLKYYRIEKESEFLSQCLEDESFATNDIFYRLSIAKETENFILFKKELVKCGRYIKNKSPKFLKSWFEQQQDNEDLHENLRKKLCIEANFIWREINRISGFYLTEDFALDYLSNSEDLTKEELLNSNLHTNKSNRTTYAIIEAGGTQIRVEVGRFYDINLISQESKTNLVFDRVLFIRHNDECIIGQPYIKDATVSVSVMNHRRGKKVIVYKMIPKKKSRKKRGHRQELTRFIVNSINLSNSSLIKK